MRKLFKKRELFKGGNYMRKYGSYKSTRNIELYTLQSVQIKISQIKIAHRRTLLQMTLLRTHKPLLCPPFILHCGQTL